MKKEFPRRPPTNENLYDYFITRVRNNLHIVLCFSPVWPGLCLFFLTSFTTMFTVRLCFLSRSVKSFVIVLLNFLVYSVAVQWIGSAAGQKMPWLQSQIISYLLLKFLVRQKSNKQSSTPWECSRFEIVLNYVEVWQSKKLLFVFLYENDNLDSP